MKKPVACLLFFMFIIFRATISSTAQSNNAPWALRVDLLRNPEKVYRNGLLTAIKLKDAAGADLQYCSVNSKYPSFSWAEGRTPKTARQVAYQVLLSTNKEQLLGDKATVWNSGKIFSADNTGVVYSSKALSPSTVYYWKVRVWYKDHNSSAYSSIQAFSTGDSLTDFALPSFVLEQKAQQALKIKQPRKGDILYDFGKDGFGRLALKIAGGSPTDTLLVHVGEALTTDGHVNTHPPGTVRYQLIKLPLKSGQQVYQPEFTPDKRNTGASAVQIPAYIGVVLPFRYVEVAGLSAAVKIENITRNTVTIPFDDKSTGFTCSDTSINRLWDFCKYTVKSTSFAGLYIDGDRERIPYEADALINQLSHYSGDAEFLMAERTLKYLIDHPTWPTEWSLQNVFIAWNDYLYSGDKRLIKALYPDLKNKLLTALAREDGLISTRTGKQTDAFLKSIHLQTFVGNPAVLKDIVDWPQQGGGQQNGETDGFEFKDYNSVVNAYHYAGLEMMARLATAVSENDDRQFYQARAAKVKQAFTKVFINEATGLVVDGEGSTHSSLHANMFALTFNLVPAQNMAAVLRFIHSRGMVCSVYGAQFLLSGLYAANDAGYALQLLRSKEKRGWFNMLDEGATMTMEAWGQGYKPNQDWNHAWGTAPANYIVRNLMGVQPLLAGFATLQIKPEPADIKSASLRYLTIRGNVNVSFNNTTEVFKMSVQLPSNTSATVYLPFAHDGAVVLKDGKAIKAKYIDGFWIVDEVEGRHEFIVSNK